MWHGFFGYLGNKVPFTIIDKLAWMGIALILAIVIMVFKSRIYEWYHAKDRKKIIIALGIFALLLNGISRIMYSINGYPWHWEIIPLHLCRLCFLLLGIFLVMNRVDLIKWIVIPMIIGSTLAIIAPPLSSYREQNWINKGLPKFSNGVDSYYYWDFYLTHIMLFASAFVLWSAKRWTFTMKELVVWTGYFTSLGIFMFGLNGVINAINPKINADYFFLGIGSTVKIWSWLGPFSHWPFFAFTFMLGSWAIILLIYFIWVLQGYADFGKWEFYSKTQNPIIIGEWTTSNSFLWVKSKKQKK